MLQSAPSISSARALIRALQYPIRILAVFFLGGAKFRSAATKINPGFIILFYLEKMLQIRHIFRRKSEVAIFRQYNSLKNSNSLTCSQIWLIRFVNDCHSTHLTKLKKKKTKKIK
jgi:hypothetical protein